MLTEHHVWLISKNKTLYGFATHIIGSSVPTWHSLDSPGYVQHDKMTPVSPSTIFFVCLFVRSRFRPRGLMYNQGCLQAFINACVSLNDPQCFCTKGWLLPTAFSFLSRREMSVHAFILYRGELFPLVYILSRRRGLCPVLYILHRSRIPPFFCIFCPRGLSLLVYILSRRVLPPFAYILYGIRFSILMYILSERFFSFAYILSGRRFSPPTYILSERRFFFSFAYILSGRGISSLAYILSEREDYSHFLRKDCLLWSILLPEQSWSMNERHGRKDTDVKEGSEKRVNVLVTPRCSRRTHRGLGVTLTDILTPHLIISWPE